MVRDKLVMSLILMLGVFVFGGCVVGGKNAASPAEEGRRIAEAKGCFACHSTDGTIKRAPSWLGLYGAEIELEDGGSVIADESYIKESILEPQAKIGKGYGDKAIMPSFQGRITDEEISKITEYMKTLKGVHRHN